jgi:hypothetical protein
LTDNVLLQFNASRNEYQQKGMSVWWNSMQRAGYHFVPDPDRAFSQPWIKASSVTERYGVDLTWNLNSAMTLRAKYQYNGLEADTNGMVRNDITSDGT